MIKFNKADFIQKTYVPVMVLVVVFCFLGIFIIPNFISPYFISSFMTSFTPAILLAIAQAIVIMGGGIDISLGAVISLVNVVVILLIENHVSMPLAMCAGMGAGVFIGAINGFIIGYLRITPLLVTLASTSITQGLALSLMPVPSGSAPMSLIIWYQKVPAPFLLVIIGILMWCIWKFTPLHLQLNAMGNNFDKTYATGVPVKRIQFLSYLFAALIASVASIAVTANTGGGDPTIGASLTLNSVAACVIGGVALKGGIGSIRGAILGAVFLSLAFIMVMSAHLPFYFQQLASGIIVLVGILISSNLRLDRKPAVVIA